MFRPTQAVLTKASRAPLISKHANKNYFKGTGSFPGLGLKRTGRHVKAGTKAPYVMMPERMREFVVPEGLNETTLKPYVAKSAKITNEVVVQWPIAMTKPKAHVNSKRGGIYSDKGFDGEYYLQLAEQNAAVESEAVPAAAAKA